MWEAEFQSLSPRCLRAVVRQEDQPDRVLSYWEVIGLWRTRQKFCTWFTEVLAECPFAAFRWETPPVSRERLDSLPFEFVLLDAPALERPVDRRSFAAQFQGGEPGDVVAFTNLSGDAELVVPCPSPVDEAYSHLGSFLRAAPGEQSDALWFAVGNAMQQRLERQDEPVWLSTAGMGVAWLHVRLDSRPKSTLR